MTPTEIETAAREQYNAVGDTNWSQSEIMTLIYGACLELARESLCIERTFSTTTVVGQQEYSFPTNVISLKRVQYNGAKLASITFREDDFLTGQNQASTQQGTPQYYAEWNETIYLRPVPDDTKTLKIWAYVEPQAVTYTSTLEVPSRYHMDIVDYVLARMYAKDKDFNSSQYYQAMWDGKKQKAKQQEKRKAKGDSFKVVQDEELLANSILGPV